MSKEQKKREDGFEHLEEALTSGEQFIEKNQKMIVNVVLDISDTTDSLLNHMPKKLPTRFSERKTISKKILSIWP